MTTKTPVQEKGDMSVAEVAKHLSRSLGGTAQYWTTWMANDRKPGRVRRRLPVVSGVGRPRYNSDDVDALVAQIKSDQELAEEAGGALPKSTSRKLDIHVSALSTDEGMTKPKVLVVIAKPLATFLLTADEARALAHRLVTAATAVDSDHSSWSSKSPSAVE
jgi:hypothetical protein